MKLIQVSEFKLVLINQTVWLICDAKWNITGDIVGINLACSQVYVFMY